LDVSWKSDDREILVSKFTPSKPLRRTGGGVAVKLETRIRAIAKVKTVVGITLRTRSQKGFVLFRPDGLGICYPNKKTALAALLAQLRCAPVQIWRVTTP
jgi:hypothetical protein